MDQQSVSVVVPVHNAQHTLTRQTTEMLDVLSDVSERFELLIVDDASTDQTEEICHELARQYPQVEVYRQPARTGVEEAVAEGIRRSRGEIVFVQDTPAVSPMQLRRLWETRMELPGADQTVAATSSESLAEPWPEAQPLKPGLVGELVDWGTRLVARQHADEGSGAVAPPKLRRRAATVASAANAADQATESDERRMKIRRR